MNFISNPITYHILVLVVGIIFIIYERSDSHFIRKTIIPFYDALESEYGAKYPTVMRYPVSDAFEELLYYKKKDLTFYFFVKDNSFVIVRETDPDFYIEIPFSDVLCQYCTYNHLSQCFDIDFHFVYNSKIKKLTFHTIIYNHKLDKKYGNRLTGEELFEFVRNTFIHENEYTEIHGYDSLPH